VSKQTHSPSLHLTCPALPSHLNRGTVWLIRERLLGPAPPAWSRHNDDEVFRRGERMGRVGFDSRIFFPWDGRSPVSHPTCEVPFPPRRSGEYRKGMIPARPLYQGGLGSGWDPEPPKERVGDWGGPATVWSLLYVAETRATRPNGEWGYRPRRQCWATSAQRWCHPEEALYLPTFSHLFDCQ
jgi:hypothetical protein